MTLSIAILALIGGAFISGVVALIVSPIILNFLDTAFSKLSKCLYVKQFSERINRDTDDKKYRINPKNQIHYPRHLRIGKYQFSCVKMIKTFKTTNKNHLPKDSLDIIVSPFPKDLNNGVPNISHTEGELYTSSQIPTTENEENPLQQKGGF